jgi:hypothetical protein
MLTLINLSFLKKLKVFKNKKLKKDPAIVWHGGTDLPPCRSAAGSWRRAAPPCRRAPMTAGT